MEEAIAQTIARMETGAFRRGTNDCDAIMADYVQMLTGKDPMAAWRGRYDDDAGAEAFISDAGGNANLVETGMASIGIAAKPGHEARRGDVVVADFKGDQVTGLCLGGLCAFKTRKGCHRTNALPVIKAWSLPCV